jgi:histone deacetylase HOS2
LQQALGETGVTGVRPNKNSDKKVRDIVSSITEQLRFVNMAPSVQSKAIPPDLTAWKDSVDEEFRERKEEADGQYRRDKERALGIAMEFGV